jgi:excisionase family DNA binding protein
LRLQLQIAYLVLLAQIDPYIQPMSESTPFLSVAELAETLSLSRTRAYQLVHAGEVPSTRWGGVIRIPRAALERWLADQEREALASVHRGEQKASPMNEQSPHIGGLDGDSRQGRPEASWMDCKPTTATFAARREAVAKQSWPS